MDGVRLLRRVPACSQYLTLAALKSGDSVVIQVERDGGLMYVTLELE